MSFLTPDVVAGVVRHILTIGAGYFIAKGIVDEATATTIIAGIVAFVGVVWSVAAKKQA